MRKKSIITIIFIVLLIFLSGILSIHIFSEDKKQKNDDNGKEAKIYPIECTADYMEYYWKEGILHARGNVNMKYQNITLKADKIDANSNTEDVEAEGNIIMVENEQTLKGTMAKYNLREKK